MGRRANVERQLKILAGAVDNARVDDLTREFLMESQEGLDRMERCLTELERRPADGELIAEIFRAVHTIKGGTGFLGFGRLETLAHVGESLLGSLRTGTIGVTGELIDGLLALLDGLQAILRLIATTGGEGKRRSDDDFELIGRLIELQVIGRGQQRRSRRTEDPIFAMEEAGAEAGVEGRVAGGLEVSEEAAAVLQMADVAERRAVTGGADKTLRVDVEVLNRMMNLVGELVLTRNGVLQSGPGTEGFAELGRRLDAVTSDLRETVMRARMQPLGYLFAKFPRMVRDLAQVCGRRVRLECDGHQTGLDKGLLEAVRDPLTHAVRNAVDHGIEPPEVRVAAGKHPEGVVRLSAYHRNGSVVMEVSDDGAGISPDCVLRKAVERGLVSAEQAARMSARDALHLIFTPGFSLAAEVTSVSGRGVGMDVVRANVERVGGSVEIESHAGVGTTLRIRVPLTLAIVPALVVRSGSQSFALPQSALMELVYVPERESETAIGRVGGAELYRLRERLVPLLRLSRLLGWDEVRNDALAGVTIAFVEAHGGCYGLIVEGIVGPEEIVVKPLSAALQRIGLFAGATVLGNGDLALILDVAGIGTQAGVRKHERRVPAELAVDDRRAEESHTGRVLVVYEVMRQTDRGRKPERMALPLGDVERIEVIERDQIEFAGGVPMLRHRGELFRVEDEGGLLERPGCGQVTLLICTRTLQDGELRVAVAVERVLDVCPGGVDTRVHEGGSGELAVIGEQVTLLRGGFDAEAGMGVLEEVM